MLLSCNNRTGDYEGFGLIKIRIMSSPNIELHTHSCHLFLSPYDIVINEPFNVLQATFWTPLHYIDYM